MALSPEEVRKPLALRASANAGQCGATFLARGDGADRRTDS